MQKHAAAAGLGDVKVEYLLVDGGNHINDAMLAGTLDIASIGTGGYLVMWAKTKGNAKLEVIGLGAAASGGMILATRNPAVKSLRDFTEKDRIAVPGIKTSLGAILLHMAAAKEFGDENYAKLDPLTVGLPHPDAVAPCCPAGARSPRTSGVAALQLHRARQPGHPQGVQLRRCDRTGDHHHGLHREQFRSCQSAR